MRILGAGVVSRFGIRERERKERARWEMEDAVSRVWEWRREGFQVSKKTGHARKGKKGGFKLNRFN